MPLIRPGGTTVGGDPILKRSLVSPIGNYLWTRFASSLAAEKERLKMMRYNPKILGLIASAYKDMAMKVQYRPAAPGDGWRNIDLDKEELQDPEVLNAESEKYAKQFFNEERDTFSIGRPDFKFNRAMVFTIEAARLLCSCGMESRAEKLLRMALNEMKTEKDRKLSSLR